MAHSEETRQKLEQIRDEMAQEDPTVLELDIDDPDTAVALVLTAALLKGASISVAATDENGRTETIAASSLGKGADGEHIMGLEIGSSDGTLSPESADLAAELIRPSFEAEIGRLTAEDR